MYKHSFVYTVVEEFVKVDAQTKTQIKKIKLRNDSNLPGSNYNNFFHNEEKPKLTNLIYNELKDVFVEHNLRITNCWVQKYIKNNYHGIHTHFNNKDEKSFVWFIEGKEDSSPLKFYDVGYPLIQTDQSITVKFIPGILLIFPGFLPHEVPVNKNNNRLIVSGNVI